MKHIFVENIIYSVYYQNALIDQRKRGHFFGS